MSKVSHVVAAAALFLGCSDSPSEPARSRFALSLALSSSSFAAGEPVDWTLTVSNRGNAAGRLDFSSGCQANFLVRDGSGVVWNDRWVTLCADVLTHVELGPGESAEYRGSWRQQTANGSAPPGSYSAQGELLTTPPIADPGVTFAIRP